MLNPLNFLSKIIKSSNQKELDKLKKTTKKINDLEKQIIKMDDKSFPIKTKELIDKGFLSKLNITVLLLQHDSMVFESYQDEMDYICTMDKRNKFIRNLALNQE